MSICARCQEPIARDEDAETFAPDTGTGAAPAVYLHKELCKKSPHQSAPDGPIHRY